MKPTMGSLFAGIGGFDLGFERAGFETTWQVEIDPWARKVLAKNFPNAERFEDVRTVGAHNLKFVDVICGGFPCQDISNAGLRAGIEGARSGLWSEYARIIRELQPRFVLVENVAALLGRGMGRVLGDLAEIGYDAEWEVVSAADVGAPHLRERIWILAYPCGTIAGRGTEQFKGGEPVDGQPTQLLSEPCGGSGEAKAWDHYRDVAHAGHKGILERGWDSGTGAEDRFDGRAKGDVLSSEPAPQGSSYGEDATVADGEQHEGGSPAHEWATAAELPADANGDNGRERRARRLAGDCADGQGERSEALADAGRAGREELDAAAVAVAVAEGFDTWGAAEGRLPGWWAVEPSVGRVANGIPKRVDRLRGLGNAVVPQIPEMYAQRIKQLLENS